MSILFSIWTVIVFVFFIGVVIWAMSSKRKKEFDEASLIPFKEDDKPQSNNQQEKNNG